jgi:hypothetical protein
MYICMYVYMYAGMLVFYICVYIYIYIYICIYANVYIRVYLRQHVRIYVRMHCMYIYVYNSTKTAKVNVSSLLNSFFTTYRSRNALSICSYNARETRYL